MSHICYLFEGLTFSLWFGAFAPCRSGIDFTMPAKGSRAAHDNRKVRCGLRQIHFHHKGMEGFTESVLNTEVIRKQRCTFASSKRKAQTAMEAEAWQSGIGDFPHSTLGKRSLQIGIIFLKPHGIALSLHRD